ASYVVFGHRAPAIQPSVSIAVSPAAVLESSTTGLVYTFARAGDISVPLAINFTTSGNATFTNDFTASSSGTLDFSNGTLTIPAGSASATLTLAPVDDLIVEGSESVTLTVAADSSYSVTGSPAIGTITDNDTATLSFATGTSSPFESGGAQNVGVQLLITANGVVDTGTLGEAVSVNMEDVLSGTATAGGADYTFTSPLTLTFAAGSSGATQNATLLLDDDTIVEGTETIDLALNTLNDSTGQITFGSVLAHTVSITDNDAATLQFVTESSNVGEAAGMQNVGVQLIITGNGVVGTGTLGKAVTVNVQDLPFGAATAGGVDYTFTSPSTLTFAAGSSGATQNAILSLNDDALVEGTEQIEFGLNILGDTTGQVALGAGVTHSVLILDNDTATIGFASTSSTVSEGTPNDTLTLVLSITANGTGTAALAQEVTLFVTGGGGTAFGGGIDYTLPFLITFPSGSLDGATQTADLGITDDAQVENAETAILGLALFGDGTGQVRIANGASGMHTTTITDNDTATVTLTGGLAQAEGQSGTTAYTFTATLDHAVQGGFSVAYLTNDGTATLADQDYVDNDGTLIFAGAAGETQTITLLVNGDTQFENDETFIVTLGALSGAPAGVSVADAPQTGTITNDDPLPTISIADTAVLEGDTGASFVVFTVSLTNASILPVAVDFATANGTAIAPGDYTAIPHDSLTFAPGETSKTVSVAIRSETLFESGADETFMVQLSNPGNATLGDAQADGTILNDDRVPASTITPDAKHSFTFFDRNHDKVTVKLKGPGAGTLILDGGALDNADISEINLTGTTNKSALSIAVKKDKGTGDGVVGIGEVTIDGALKSFIANAADITVGGVRASGALNAITTHALLAGEILTGGAATDKLALSLGGLGIGGDPFLIATPQSIKSLKAVSVSPGEIEAAALGSIAVSAGPLAADITSVGAIAKITVKGGDLSGDLTAASFGKVTVKGGNFSGSLTSLTPGATLGKSKALTSLTVSDGNLTGDLRLLGAIGAISVKSKRAPAAGSITGASIVASAIAKLTFARDFTDSIVLAGADLGTDHAFGGGDDTFAAGTIGAVKIGGQVSGAGSIIGAGFSTTNTILKDDDDSIIGGVASVIAKLNITGAAAPESYFAAGLFKSVPKIAGQAVSPTADLRFKTA
ncbi:MAG: Calx-beta domain-containing protein, partial [Chthoniobacteraceae bacterium]